MEVLFYFNFIYLVKVLVVRYKDWITTQKANNESFSIKYQGISLHWKTKTSLLHLVLH